MKINLMQKVVMIGGLSLSILVASATSIIFSSQAEAKVIRYKNGVYNGQFTYGANRKPVPHGQGSYTWNGGSKKRYSGGFSRGKFAGTGDLYYRNGTHCHGNFNAKLQINSYARCKFANGNRYEGTMERGKRHNFGVFFYRNGAVYRGDWKWGKKHGRGKMKFANGNSYNGPWVNGKRHTRGEGVYVFKRNGSKYYRYIGQFANNRMHGKGEVFFFGSRKRLCVVMNAGKIVSKRKSGSRRSSCYN